MAKNKLTKPTVSLTRTNYKFTLSFSNIDSDADYIHIELFLNDCHAKNIQLGAKKNSSWSYTLDKSSYYPFVNDKDANGNPKQSSLSLRFKKIAFKVWVDGTVNVKHKYKEGKKWKTKTVKTYMKSDSVTKSYSFAPSVAPSVAIAYNQDGTSFSYAVDINDDYGIDDNSKKVATRCWAWLTRKTYLGNEYNVPNYEPKWYNRDSTTQIRNQINAEISATTPIKYTIHAYSAGPGGKSDVVEAYHVFAVPLTPQAPRVSIPCVLVNSEVDYSYGLYDFYWNIDTKKGWFPVDYVNIEYADNDKYKGASMIYGEDMSWSVAKENISKDITSIRSNELGAPAADTVRYFRLKVYHDGNEVPGYVTGVAGYGRPTNVSNVTASTQTINDEDVLVFKWDAPPTKLYGTDQSTVMYNGERLGPWGCARIAIYKNSYTSANNIAVIRYDPTKGWDGNEFIYHIPASDIGKEIDYGFQVRVGLDSGDPGGKSEVLWLERVIVPAKCKHVTGRKMSDNTTVEVSWENPIKDDTIRNGIEIAWSSFVNAWESNSQPSTMQFENGAMTKAYVTGLTEGETYYFWVRLYNKTDETTTYGPWSDMSKGVLMSDDPDVPSLTLSRSWIKEGGNLSAQWVYSSSGNMPQVSAQVELSSDKKTWTPIATVSGEEDNALLNFSEKINNKYKYTVGDYYLRVVVSNATGSSTSEAIDLKIAEPPKCQISNTSLETKNYPIFDDEGEIASYRTVKALTSMPLTLKTSISSGSGNLNLYLYCIDGFSMEHPDKTDNVFQGDCIWSSPVEEGSVTITNASLMNNARYRLQLECVDPDTLLSAKPKHIDFEAQWDHQAVAPESSTVTIAIDEETGNTIATLIPIKPEGALDTDVCDIYRVTVDGCCLCYENATWGESIIDTYPTFSNNYECSYRFCTKTTDGDEAWVDISYELAGYGIIVNYGNKVVKLPWNVTIDDSRTKQGEIRSHLGGTKTYYGQPYIDRSQNLSTDVVKIDDEALIEQLYELSRFTELCYVRTSNGIGFPATIDVTINQEYNNNIVSVSLSAKEADANREFLGTNKQVTT